MINSLLSISIEATIFDIFIILGVVIAASLIVYFIWEAVLTYSKKQKGGSASSNKVEANKQEDWVVAQIKAALDGLTAEQVSSLVISMVSPTL